MQAKKDTFMDTFAVLEEKIGLLVAHIKKLQTEKNDLASQRDSLLKKNEGLNVESARLAEENAQLNAKVQEAERSSAKGNKQLDALSKERELTKIAVDDLIKSIDGLVKSEKQQ